ncbi:MAG: hypothetical protein DRP76_03365 [Candidatus Omnitrophota bacterium]|nr:MAG: hypothetical protein DRP76_03365 [Candidatus Omnitrophota bacterium]
MDRDTQNFIFQFLNKLKKKKIDKEEFLKILEKALTKEEKKHIQDIYVRKNKLIIKVDSSVWGYQFNLLIPEMLKLLKRKNVGIDEIKVGVER